MTRVKICGLTRYEDAQCALEAGAHALGFVLEPTSPRCLPTDSELLARLAELGPYVTRVAVFGPPRDVDLSRFDAVQSLGERVDGKRFVRVLRVAPGSPLKDDLGDWDAVLLDAFSPEQYGGTGARIDWGWAAEFVAASPKPVVLAGGLNPSNVAEAIRIVRPYAVDVASGVESAPGIKDHHLIRAFVQEATGS